MYSTTKQIHVAIDTLFQQVASNRKRTYHPEEIDIIYNRCMLKYISMRSNPKTNIKVEGREQSVKRVDDLKGLKARKSLPAFIDSPNLQYCILPSNYRQFTDGQAKITYNCRGLKDIEVDVAILYKSVLPFDDDTSSDELFKDFKIVLDLGGGNIYTLFDINTYINFVGFRTNYAKFEIINLVLDSILLSNIDIEIYWENYGSDYHANSFIIITRSNAYITSGISYGNMSFEEPFTAITNLEKYIVEGESLTVSCDLIPSEDIGDILMNSMMIKNRHESPLIELEDNRILIHHNSKFIINSFLLRYDKKPIFMNYKANILPSLLDRADEIISMVVASMAITTSGNIQGILQESQMNE